MPRTTRKPRRTKTKTNRHTIILPSRPNSRMRWARGFIYIGTEVKFLAFFLSFAVFGTAALLMVHADPSAVVQVNDNTTGTGLNQVTYKGEWGSTVTDGAFNGDMHFSESAKASYRVTFRGTHVAVRAPKGPAYGIATYQIDSSDAATVDHYADGVTHGTAVFSSQPLANTEHTLTVTAAGKKNPQSSGETIPADLVEVTSVGGVSSPAR